MFIKEKTDKSIEDIELFSLIYRFLLWYFYGKEMKKSVMLNQETVKVLNIGGMFTGQLWVKK